MDGPPVRVHPEAEPAVRTNDGTTKDSPAPSSMGAEDADVRTTLAKVLAVVSSIGPPVTVATALLVYFGWARSDAQARAMGLDVSLFGYTVQDYALRSIRSLFFPLVSFLIVALAWLAADGWVHRRLRPGRRNPRMARLSAGATIGGVGLAAACWLLAVALPRGAFLAVPFLMAAGVLLAEWGVRLHRLTQRRKARFSMRWAVQHRALEATFVFTLVTVLLFWGVSDFAQVVGRGLAANVEAALPSMPRADVYSRAELSIGAPGVAEARLGAATAPLYKYTGMHLLVVSGGRIFLLPDSWTLARGTVVVLPDNDNIRVEYSNR